MQYKQLPSSTSPVVCGFHFYLRLCVNTINIQNSNYFTCDIRGIEKVNAFVQYNETQNNDKPLVIFTKYTNIP